MGIVIVGGHDCMVCEYKKLCEQYNCKAKVFTQMNGTFKNKIGCPDLLVLFTSTVSHKMVKCALGETKKGNTIVERAHSSSIASLKSILDKHIINMR